MGNKEMIKYLRGCDAFEAADALITADEYIERLQAELAESRVQRYKIATERNALAIQVEQLRGTLEFLRSHLGVKFEIPSTAPAAELIAAHDAKVIERCAAHVDCPVVDTGHGFAAALRALIAAPKEVK